MKIWFVVLPILAVFGFLLFVNKGKDNNLKDIPQSSSGSFSMKISSSAFNNSGSIPTKYTCDGQDINPPLTFSDIPAGTKSLALIVEDPDAPSGTWTHWIVWNIDPTTSTIDEGFLPEGSIEGTNSFSSLGYGGPCPPGMQHRYLFKLYALDSTLDLPKETLREKLLTQIETHKISEAQLTGSYKR